jgi:hypothetical protein
MIRVERIAVEPDVAAITVQLDLTLSAVVTGLAQGLQLAQPELVDVAVMRLDVIADGRGLDDAALRAVRTERMLEQLVPPDPGPASRGVPRVPPRWPTAIAHSIQPLV